MSNCYCPVYSSCIYIPKKYQILLLWASGKFQHPAATNLLYDNKITSIIKSSQKIIKFLNLDLLSARIQLYTDVNFINVH